MVAAHLCIDAIPITESQRDLARAIRSRRIGILANSTGNPKSALVLYDQAQAELNRSSEDRPEGFELTLKANVADGLRRAHAYRDALGVYEAVFPAARDDDRDGGLGGQVCFYALYCARRVGCAHVADLWLRRGEDIQAAREAWIGEGAAAEAEFAIHSANAALVAADWNAARGSLSGAFDWLGVATSLFGGVGGGRHNSIVLRALEAKLAWLAGHSRAAGAYLRVLKAELGGAGLMPGGRRTDVEADAALWRSRLAGPLKALEAERHLREAISLYDAEADAYESGLARLELAFRFAAQSRVDAADRAVTEASADLSLVQSDIASAFLAATQACGAAGWPDRAEAAALLRRSLNEQGVDGRVADHEIRTRFETAYTPPRPACDTLKGRHGTVRRFRQGIETAIWAGGLGYDQVVVFGRPALWLRRSRAPLVSELRKPFRSTLTVLTEITRLADANGWRKIAVMPFGHGSNACLRIWADTAGPFAELDIYCLDDRDFSDVFENAGD